MSNQFAGMAAAAPDATAQILEIVNAAAETARIPGFWREEPGLWFATVENVFASKQITSSLAKYHLIMPLIPCDIMTQVRDLVTGFANNEDPYQEVKDRLTDAFGKSGFDMAAALQEHPALGSEKPSVLMGKLLALLPPGDKADTRFRYEFVRRLPDYMRSQLGRAELDTTAKLAKAADEAWTTHAGHAGLNVAAATFQPTRARSPTPHRQDSGQRSGGGQASGGRWSGKTPMPRKDGLCHLHAKFGADAYRCQAPCTWSGNGPTAGGNN